MIRKDSDMKTGGRGIVTSLFMSIIMDFEGDVIYPVAEVEI